MDEDELELGYKYLLLADKHLDEVTDPTLIILKGHLVVERALYDSVRYRMLSPQYLDAANLRFHQVANVARAIFSITKKTSDGISKQELKAWDAIFALNSLRNKLAHQLDHEELKPLFDRLFVIHPQQFKSLDEPHLASALHGAIAFILGFLAGSLTDERRQNAKPTKK